MRKLASKFFFIASIACFFGGTVLASDLSCGRPTELSCDYYRRCVESQYPCGPKGYAIGYGQMYCQRFLDTSYTTYQGDVWRDATVLCLQNALSLFVFYSPYQTKTCSTIKTNAYESHASCYVRPIRTRPDISICYLSPAEVAITTHNIKTVDMFRWLGLKQMTKVAKLCLEIFNKSSTPFTGLNGATQAQRDFWKSVLAEE